MSGRSDFIEHGGSPSPCAVPEKWQQVEDDRREFRATLKRIETKIDSHTIKLFEGNGKEPIIPHFDKRLMKLEAAMVPRDDVMGMVNAFKVGRTIIIAIATVASIGFAATLFWSLFRRVNP